MTGQPAIPVQTIDRSDARVRAARESEQRLFEYYGLEPKTHYVEIEALNIGVRVLDVGSGPPVLMAPGGSGEAFVLVRLVAELAGWRIIAVNRPGGGLSDAVDHRQIDMRRLAVDTLTAVLDAFELDSVPIIANSMGGLWTFWLALDKPERVSAIVQLGCPALILGTSAPRPMRLLSVPLVNRLLFPVSRPDDADQAREALRMIGCSSETRQALPDVLPETIYRMFNLPARRTAWLSLMEAALTVRGANKRYQLGPDELRRVRQPVLFIWGDHDPFGGVDVGRQAVDLMRDAELEVIGAGHAPFIDDPKACARLIRDFLPRPV